MSNFIVNYIKDSIQELNKVTWPTKNQSIKITLIVLVFCAISAFVLLLLDGSFNYLYQLLILN